jgi:hypothetical protein
MALASVCFSGIRGDFSWICVFSLRRVGAMDRAGFHMTLSVDVLYVHAVFLSGLVA